MKKYILSLAAVCCMLTFFSISASALEYSFDAPDAGLFGRPTSDNTIYVTTDEPANTNRGKDAAYIPPAFGSPTSYTLNAGERLTPNLVSGSTTGAVSGTGGVTICRRAQRHFAGLGERDREISYLHHQTAFPQYAAFRRYYKAERWEDTRRPCTDLWLPMPKLCRGNSYSEVIAANPVVQGVTSKNFGIT